MRHHDLIRIQIENRLYERLVLEVVEYAILSLPYTINRMELKETSTRIQNRGLAFQYLPSFLNLYPRLKESMAWGTILGQGF